MPGSNPETDSNTGADSNTEADSDESDTGSESRSVPAGTIAGGVAGGIGGIAIIATLAWYTIRRKHARQNSTIEISEHYHQPGRPGGPSELHNHSARTELGHQGMPKHELNVVERSVELPVSRPWISKPRSVAEMDGTCVQRQ